jgi:hypothetical protein
VPRIGVTAKVGSLDGTDPGEGPGQTVSVPACVHGLAPDQPARRAGRGERRQGVRERPRQTHSRQPIPARRGLLRRRTRPRSHGIPRRAVPVHEGMEERHRGGHRLPAAFRKRLLPQRRRPPQAPLADPRRVEALRRGGARARAGPGPCSRVSEPSRRPLPRRCSPPTVADLSIATRSTS